MDLLPDDELARSPVVANCQMNRERSLAGSNGYDRELGFHPIDELRSRHESGQPLAWLDLCCGTGKALVEAVRIARDEGLDLEIVGVDLVGTFPTGKFSPPGLRLLEANLDRWRPDRPFDLITCVHGLHYIGDKLGLLTRASSWLTADGLFAASLDLANLVLAGGRPATRAFAASLRRSGFAYEARRHLLTRRGSADVSLPYRYLGALDNAGPNYTGQPAVDSFYEVAKPSG